MLVFTLYILDNMISNQTCLTFLISLYLPKTKMRSQKRKIQLQTSLIQNWIPSSTNKNTKKKRGKKKEKFYKAYYGLFKPSIIRPTTIYLRAASIVRIGWRRSAASAFCVWLTATAAIASWMILLQSSNGDVFPLLFKKPLTYLRLHQHLLLATTLGYGAIARMLRWSSNETKILKEEEEEEKEKKARLWGHWLAWDSSSHVVVLTFDTLFALFLLVLSSLMERNFIDIIP